jgi:hypothetical protein
MFVMVFLCILASWESYTGWGSQSWTKTVFLIYRPSCLIEAYVRPEKYRFVSAGPLANHSFNFNLILYFYFLASA